MLDFIFMVIEIMIEWGYKKLICFGDFFDLLIWYCRYLDIIVYRLLVVCIGVDVFYLELIDKYKI